MTTASGPAPAGDPPPEAQAAATGDASPAAQATAAEVEAAVAERTIFFSDAVVAIAITLLALALPLPTGIHNIDMLKSLQADGDAYIAFLISFVVIGNHWSAHRRLFRYVDRLDKFVMQLNMVWLLTMVLTPFATRLVSGSGALGIRFTIYAGVQAVAGLCLLLMTLEVRRGQLLRPGAPEYIGSDRIRGLIVIIAMFVISIPISFATPYAYLCWVAIPLVMRIQGRLFPARPGPGADSGRPAGDI
jgi:uncharacterized membrane protein